MFIPNKILAARLANASQLGSAHPPSLSIADATLLSTWLSVRKIPLWNKSWKLTATGLKSLKFTFEVKLWFSYSFTGSLIGIGLNRHSKMSINTLLNNIEHLQFAVNWYDIMICVIINHFTINPIVIRNRKLIKIICFNIFYDLCYMNFPLIVHCAMIIKAKSLERCKLKPDTDGNMEIIKSVAVSLILVSMFPAAFYLSTHNKIT